MQWRSARIFVFARLVRHLPTQYLEYPPVPLSTRECPIGTQPSRQGNVSTVGWQCQCTGVRAPMTASTFGCNDQPGGRAHKRMESRQWPAAHLQSWLAGVSLGRRHRAVVPDGEAVRSAVPSGPLSTPCAHTTKHRVPLVPFGIARPEPGVHTGGRAGGRAARYGLTPWYSACTLGYGPPGRSVPRAARVKPLDACALLRAHTRE